MKRTTYKVEMTFTEPLLGGACNNPEVHAEHIASKAETVAEVQEEVEAISGHSLEKALGVFPKDETGLFYWNYQLRGFFKEQIASLVELGDVKEVSKWSVKKAVNMLVYAKPRRIYLMDEKGKHIKDCQTVLSRPLKAETLQGPRIALASSQMLPAGTNISFMVELLEVDNAKSKCRLKPETIEAALAFGSQQGFGQWRTAHYGQFDYSIKEVK